MAPVLRDVFARFVLTLDEAGHLPARSELMTAVTQTATVAAEQLLEPDKGDWVDPNAIAGTVADLCDGALNIVRLCQLQEQPPGSS